MYKHLLLTLSLLFTVACSVGPDYQEPDLTAMTKVVNPDPEQYKSDSEVVHEWWNGFNDPELSKLIGDAFAANHDIRIAAANLMEARALLSETSYDLFPTIRSGADYTAIKSASTGGSTSVTSTTGSTGTSGATGGGTSTGTSTSGSGSDRRFELYRGYGSVSWELDFLGRVRRSVEAEDAYVDASEASLRDAMVLVAAEVAQNYFQLRGTQARTTVARINADNQKESSRLTQAILDAGRGTELDTSRARAQLNVTLATVPQFEQIVQKAIYRLSVLTGRGPTELEGELQADKPLPAAPLIIGIGSVSDLLKRRPDVVSAERNLAASSALIGVAMGDYFPRVTLVGEGGVQATSPRNFDNKGAGYYQIGPRISWAALDLGRVRAEVRQTDARFEAALAQYEKTVLIALEELQGALVQYQKLKEATGYLRIASENSARAAFLARAQYQDGATDFLSVLDADRVKLEAEDKLRDSETQTAVALVTVYKALGGGWTKDAAPTPVVASPQVVGGIVASPVDAVPVIVTPAVVVAPVTVPVAAAPIVVVPPSSNPAVVIAPVATPLP